MLHRCIHICTRTYSHTYTHKKNSNESSTKEVIFRLSLFTFIFLSIYVHENFLHYTYLWTITFIDNLYIYHICHSIRWSPTFYGFHLNLTFGFYGKIFRLSHTIKIFSELQIWPPTVLQPAQQGRWRRVFRVRLSTPNIWHFTW